MDEAADIVPKLGEPRLLLDGTDRLPACQARTLAQGSSVSFWKTTPRSPPGPATGMPSRSIEPEVRERNPPMALRSVDFPQPDAPTATMMLS
jgi:hypothetical protein